MFYLGNIMKGDMNRLSEQVVRLLHGKNIAFVATLMKDGSPQITPTWVDLDGNEIVVNTAKGRVKEKNLSRDPRIAIAIADQNNPYHMVTIRGKVIDQTTRGADEHIDKLSKKYLDLDKYPLRSLSEERIVIKISPDKVFYQPPQG
jgi:PPOX class probable F420-dependent enzyme